MTEQITAWSFSRYTGYRQCPLKFKLKHIDRIREPANAAMSRGSKIHTIAEHYIKGAGRQIPNELKMFSTLFKSLRSQFKKTPERMIVETTWAFTKTWGETQWNDWDNCWLRIKLDCVLLKKGGDELNVFDWKTGKFRPDSQEDYLEQLELYALGALLIHPDVTHVRPQLIYLDQFQTYPDPAAVFSQDMVPALKKLWVKRTQPMMRDKNFAPRPNQFCHWCHYRNDNKVNGGGQCKF